MAEAGGWRRRGAVALLGATAASLLAFPAAPPAGAGDFELGSGRVRSNLFEVVPRTGGLTIPYSGGKASAAYQGRRAQATATVGKPPLLLAPKILTDLLEGDPPAAPVSAPTPANAQPYDCGDKAPGGGGGGDPGAPPTSSPFTFNLSTNSDEENSEAGKRRVFATSPADSPVQGAMAEQEVVATDDPSGEAVATQGRMGVAGVFEMFGGRSEATSGVVEGKARQSAGSVTIDRLSLIDGLVVLEGMRWEAVQRTGDAAGTRSGFSMGRAIIAGTPLAPPDSGSNDEAFFKAVNQALAPTGLMIDPPRVDDDDNDARVTAMSLRLSDSPIGRAAVGPVVGTAQPVRDPLVDAALGFSCDLGLFVTVADVILSGASGSGGVSFDFGGITATTDGTVFDNPFGSGFGDDFGGGFGELPPADLAAAGPASGLGGPATAATAGPVPAPLPAVTGDFGRGFRPPGVGSASALPVTDSPPIPGGVEEVAAPDFAPQIQPALGSSVRRGEGERGGGALAAGVIGLLAVVALVAFDALSIRRVAA